MILAVVFPQEVCTPALPKPSSSRSSPVLWWSTMLSFFLHDFCCTVRLFTVFVCGSSFRSRACRSIVRITFLHVLNVSFVCLSGLPLSWWVVHVLLCIYVCRPSSGCLPGSPGLGHGGRVCCFVTTLVTGLNVSLYAVVINLSGLCCFGSCSDPFSTRRAQNHVKY